MIQELRQAARTLAKSPGFAAMAMLTLALGVGPNAALFAVYDALVLRPLPLPDADHVVSLYPASASGETRGVFSYPDYADLRDRNRVLEGLAAYADRRFQVSQTSNPALIEEVHGMFVSGNYFAVLQIGMAMGRGPATSDARELKEDASVVLSYESWQRRYGSDPNIVGKTVRVNFVPCTVIGVAAAEFRGTSSDQTEVYVPIALQSQVAPGEDLIHARDARWVQVIGRLKPGIGRERAQAELSTVMGQLAAPGADKSRIELTAGSLLTPPEKRDATLGGALLLAAVSLVLLVACANVANLLLARNSTRQKEFGVRLSLGSGRWRMVRQLLAESVVISAGGGALGLLLAFWLAESLVGWIHPPGEMAANLNLSPDLRVFAFAFGVAVVSGVGCGLAPALRASRLDPATVLRGSGATGGDALGGTRLRGGLVAAQVALSAILLVTSGLLARALVKAQHTDPGFAINGVLAGKLDLSLHGYDAVRGAGYLSRLRSKVAAMPGVASVAFGEVAPLGQDFHEASVLVEGQEPPPGANVPIVHYNKVTPGYFATLGIPLDGGREFATEDLVPQAAPVAIVNEALARRFWPGQNPLGKHLRIGRKEAFAEVVGVTRDTRQVYLWSSSEPYLYLPARDADTLGLHLFVRTAAGGAFPVARLLEESRALDPSVVLRVRPLEENLAFWIWPSQVGALVAALLGGLALLLASLGLYGVVSYVASRRTREIGVRMALGAQPSSVLSLVLNQGLRLVLAGLGIGLVIAAAATRILAQFLYGLSSLDWITFAATSALLAGVALAACWIPARRAARVDPIVALRYE